MAEQKPAAGTTTTVLFTVLAAIGIPVAGDLSGLIDFAKEPVKATLVTAGVAFACLVGALVKPVVSKLRDRWADRLTDDIDAWAQRLFSGFTRAYLAQVSAICGSVELKGLTTRAGPTPGLDEVFVNLSLDPQHSVDLNANPVSAGGNGEVKPARADIWQWTRRAREARVPLVIIGPPGSGETTLLRHVAHVLSSKGRLARRRGAPAKIPVLISLRDHKDTFAAKPPTLGALIGGAIAATELPEPTGWTARQLRRRRLLVMFDGMDELATDELREIVSSWIDRQRRIHPGTTFIVSSRPFGYREFPLESALVVETQPFDRAQIETFIGRWYLAIELRSHGENVVAARLNAKSASRELSAAVLRACGSPPWPAIRCC